MSNHTKNANDGANGGLGIGTVLFLIFLVLKLVDVIDWSWWWVTAPLWGSILLYSLVIGITFFCLWIQDFNNRRKIKKWQKKREEEMSKKYEQQ